MGLSALYNAVTSVTSNPNFGRSVDLSQGADDIVGSVWKFYDSSIDSNPYYKQDIENATGIDSEIIRIMTVSNAVNQALSAKQYLEMQQSGQLGFPGRAD
jgi:hypothetical protein